MRKPIQFVAVLLKHAFTGSRLYLGWIAFLFLIFLGGVFGYAMQLKHGLVVTNMTDQVSWGAYIANFTFLVGLAAAGVMVVIPAYLYKNKPFKKIVWIGEFLAIAAVLMCMLFVTADLGRPDRAWHLIPFIGRLNWPMSILSWDIIVLSGYLVINTFLTTYAMYSRYHGGHPRRRFYIPVVFISMFWAVSIHTVTAFLYNWLGARPFWNSAIVAPRFLASAFVAGPAFLVLALQVIDKNSGFSVPKEAINGLRRIMAVMMVINLFFFACEIFTEMYTGSAHAASAIYLLHGLEGRHLLVPYIWSAVSLN
ncbi:MAG: polysulfide reductase NrfD, partial [Deltaproteobacteria bacterium]|nr:polysulfide reductase NrfD [Deltaproteobacteria bacterium]